MITTFSIEPYVKRAFNWYTHNVLVKYPLIIIFTSIMVSLVLGAGTYHMMDSRFADTVVIYTPSNAQSFDDEKVFDTLWPLKQDELTINSVKTFDSTIFVTLYTKEECPDDPYYTGPEFDDYEGPKSCNMLAKGDDMLDQISDLEAHAMQNVIVEHEGIKYSYEGNETLGIKSMCLNYDGQCFQLAGTKVGAINLLRLRSFKNLKKYGISSEIAYPQVVFDRRPSVYMAYYIGGCMPVNGSSIESVRAIRLYFTVKNRPKLYEDVFHKLEDAMSDFFYNEMDKYDFGKNLKATVLHSRTVDKGILNAGIRMAPFLLVTMGLLLVFSTIMMLQFGDEDDDAKSKWTINWVTSKPLLAPLGIFCPIMAILSGFGLLFWLDFKYLDVMLPVPFLVISIGVDDMFILVGGWQQSSKSLSVEERVEATMTDSAVAIFITSLTSALSFAIGCITHLWAVSGFCSFAAICILFDFIYQITFFAALLLYFGRLEKKNHHSVFIWKTVKPNRNSCMIESSDTLNKREMAKACGGVDTTMAAQFIRNTYAPFILHKVTKIFIGLLFCLYIGFAIYGVTQMKQGLEMKKLVPYDDPSQEYLTIDSHLYRGSVRVEIAFLNVPDIVQSENRKEIKEVVSAFENSSYTFDDGIGTEFFLREYERYMIESKSYPTDTPAFWIYRLYEWVGTNERDWGQDVIFNKMEPKIDAFRLRIGLKNGFVSEIIKQSSDEFRALALKYKKFNVKTFYWREQLADQMDVVVSNTVQTGCIGLVCMAIVAVLFIPSLSVVFWVVLSIASIDIGVVGYMSLSNIYLDPISMITIIMSIGFAIDFSAHITYGYISAAPHLTYRERTIDSMQRLAWPVFEGAFSTVLGVTVLTFIRAYTINVFYTTVALVITFGVLHALVFLPVVLDTFMPILEPLVDHVVHRKIDYMVSFAQSTSMLNRRKVTNDNIEEFDSTEMSKNVTI